MSLKDHVQLIGKFATITVDDLTIRVIIEDMRETWGRLQALITPENGSGQKWVFFARLTLVSNGTE